MSGFDLQAHIVILPVIIPLTGMAIGLILFRYRRLQAYWSLGTMLTSLAASGWLLASVLSGGETLFFYTGGWEAPFGITLVADLLGASMVIMSQFVMSFGILYAIGANDKVVRYPTFYPFFMALATGLTGTFLTGDMFNLFVFAELVVISGTVLTASSDAKNGVEAAFKYFYISLLAATFLLLANGLLYTSYGTLNMADLANRISTEGTVPLLPAAIGLLMASFLIKSAVFPLHYWQPDFHAEAPTAVHAMLSSVVVKIGVYGFIRMTTLLFIEQAEMIQTLLLILGSISIFVGGFSALGTYNIKRMLAYSTMAQIGFILAGVGWGTPVALAAAVLFTMNHSIIKAGMLMIGGALASFTQKKSADFTDLQGLGRKLPGLGIMFFIGSLGLAGIPPTNGFISKMVLFDSGLETSEYLMLALLFGGSLLTLMYTIRAFMRIFWAEPAPDLKMKKYGDRLWAPGLLMTAVIIFGIWAAPLVSLAQQTADSLMQPANYIQIVLGG
jgi:multicomponent Na+:H+ antiporter subunit D